MVSGLILLRSVFNLYAQCLMWELILATASGGGGRVCMFLVIEDIVYTFSVRFTWESAHL